MFMFITPRKALAPWVLALEQESYLSYIKKVIKKILQTAGPSDSSLDVIIFLFLNISYIVLHSGHFLNLKTNQLISKKKAILKTHYTKRNIIDV